MRCTVLVAVGTRPIRALFAREKPPVLDTEWDEAGYIEQRLRSYAEALEAIALVRPAPCDGGDGSTAAADDDGDTALDGGNNAKGARSIGASFCCPRTGDRVRVEPADHRDGARGDAQTGVERDIERALLRVFDDAHAWRRHLLPAYFERHRNWRAVVGAPIQH